MKFDVVTLFPELITQGANHSIIKRAIDNNKISINTHNPRNYSLDKHKKVDDSPYGGGAGMVLSCQPYLDCIKAIDQELSSKKIILTPQGKNYSQDMAEEFSKIDQLIIICGHYEGYDERIRELSEATEVSIGDFVLTGGEYPALCIIDSTMRLIPGVLGDETSATTDSHSDGLLEYSQYTKPREYNGLKVPEVLLSGNHSKIEHWRRKQQLIRTKEKRPDLYNKFLKEKHSKFDAKIIEEINKEL